MQRTPTIYPKGALSVCSIRGSRSAWASDAHTGECMKNILVINDEATVNKMLAEDKFKVVRV